MKIKAKKSLGQHFLRSERALSAIVRAGNIESTNTVLEIGPGEGVMTEKLLETGAKVIAVEKDDTLSELLKKKFEAEISSKQLVLVHDDILKFEPPFGKWKLVANIPYNITGKILEKFLSSDNQPESMVLLIQKEVAERIVARDKKESILSISVKVYGAPRIIETVKAGSFVPAPKVDSAIIAIENISKDFFANISEKSFFKLVNAGFKSKRKKLSSNLGVVVDKSALKDAFLGLGLDENARAEDININTWRKLAEKLLS